MLTLFKLNQPMKSVTVLMAALMALFLLAACGGDEPTPTATSAPIEEVVETAVPEVEEVEAETETEEELVEETGYPVTISHKYGETVVPAKPERVVTVGYTEHDVWVALGTQPIAVRYWYGDESEPFRPWAADHVTA